MKNRTKKRRIYALYGSRDGSLTARRKTYYKLEDLLAKMPAGLPIDNAWDQIFPVGREFGSRDYERLAELDARSGTAKAAFDAMKTSRSATINQVMFSSTRKRGDR
jgi:hypothetical protein